MPANQPRNDPSLPPVLIVDGQSFPRRTLKRVLRAIGAGGLQEAATADAALAALSGARRQDWLVMCDIAIAAEAEMAFARALGKRAPAARLVVLGACKSDELGAFARLAETRDLTPFAVMCKPPSAEELRALLLRASGAQIVTSLPETPCGPRKLTPEEVTECLRAEWLHAFFQPKIALATGRTVSCEALARILHPQMGELQPAQFLGAIDAANGHRTLTACMLEHAARMVRTLRADGAALSVSINLSPDCLSEPGDGVKLAAYAGALGLRPAELVLEVSQAALIGVGPAVIDNLLIFP